jgi:hypothetical protein
MSLFEELVATVAHDLVVDLRDRPDRMRVEVWPVLHKDGTLGYDAVATYPFGGRVTDWSLTGRHPMSREERWWHDVFAAHAGSLGNVSAARAATLTVFGINPRTEAVAS